MAALTCDICGGNLSMDSSGDFALCESCGLKHTKDRLKTKALEITGTVAVSNLTHYKDIFEAAGKGIVQDVAYFIENGTDVNAKDEYGVTPLQHAAKDNSNMKVLEYLVSQGADVNPAVVSALENKSSAIKILKYLVSQGADVSGTLYWAVLHGSDLEVMKYLVSQGANLKENKDILCLAVKQYPYDIEVLKYLISQGADVNAENYMGTPPLYVAVKERVNIEVVKCLISYGADVNAEDKFFGETPLDIARTDEEKAVLEKAMEEQARIEREREIEDEKELEKLVEEQDRIERERKEEQARSWREAGLCEYCGGQIGGVFSKKCKSCGKEN